MMESLGGEVGKHGRLEASAIKASGGGRVPDTATARARARARGVELDLDDLDAEVHDRSLGISSAAELGVWCVSGEG